MASLGLVAADSPPGVCAGTYPDEQRVVGVTAPVLGGPEGKNLSAISAVSATFCGPSVEVRGTVTDVRFDGATASWAAAARYTDGYRRLIGGGATLLSGVVPFATPAGDQPFTELSGGFTIGVPADPSHGQVDRIEIVANTSGSKSPTRMYLPNPAESAAPSAQSQGVSQAWAATDNDLADATRQTMDRWWYLNSADSTVADNFYVPGVGWTTIDDQPTAPNQSPQPRPTRRRPPSRTIERGSSRPGKSHRTS